MTLQHLRTFVAVCKHNNITRAAEELYVAQPSVSRSIKELESYYHVKLFDRSKGRLQITEVGSIMLGYAKDVLNVFEAMEMAVAGHDLKPQLKVGMSTAVANNILIPVMDVFSERYKDVEVTTSVGLSKVLEEKVSKNHLDIAITERPPTTGDLEIKTIPGDTLAFFCRKGNPIALRCPIELADLIKEKIYVKPKDHATRDMFETALQAKGLKMNPTIESDDSIALISAVSQSNGVSLLSYMRVKPGVEEGTLSVVDVKDVPLHRNYYILTRSGRHISPIVKCFASACDIVANKDIRAPK